MEPYAGLWMAMVVVTSGTLGTFRKWKVNTDMFVVITFPVLQKVACSILVMLSYNVHGGYTIESVWEIICVECKLL